MAGPWEAYQTKAAPVEAGPWTQYAAPEAPSMAADVAKSAGSGLVKGVVGLAGLPGAVEDATNWIGRQTIGRVGNYARGEGFTAPTFDQVEQRRAAMGLGSQKALPSADTIQPAVEANITGPMYKPQTTPGKYAGTIAEFIPGMVLPGGTLGQRAAMAVVPGAASEFAGQMTEGTPAEPYARAGAALASGVGVAGLQALQRAPARTVIGAAAGPALNRQAVEQASTLIDDAAARGVTLTWDEALNQVTGGAVNLGNLRRGVETQLEGGATMNAAMSQRPAQVDAAARGQFNQIAPPTNNPSSIGRAVGETAEEAVDGVRQNINRLSQPYYDAAQTVLLGPAEMAQVRALPGYAEAMAAVQGNPQLMRNIQGLPENSVGFLNEVKKQLDTMGQNAAGQFNPQRNQQVASGLGQDATAVRQAAMDASNDYQRALYIQQQGRERVLQPIMDGPLGKLANRDQTTRQAIDALFPSSPVAGSAEEVTRAVGALAQRSPGVARQLVRAHAETTFNEAAQNLQAGANQFGGAKFAATIRGNPQQGQNLEAAVRALPQGDDVWTGFNRFLEILEATGKRPQMGSPTAANQAVQDTLKAGGAASEVGNAILTAGTKIPGRLRQAYERYQAGRNSAELADILLNPQSVGLFRALAREQVAVPAMVGLATRLTYMGERTTAERPAQPSR
jgi:hypothetical protein